MNKTFKTTEDISEYVLCQWDFKKQEWTPIENLKEVDGSMESEIEDIAKILFDNKTDEGDEGSWIESKDFYKVAKIIAGYKAAKGQ